MQPTSEKHSYLEELSWKEKFTERELVLF